MESDIRLDQFSLGEMFLLTIAMILLSVGIGAVLGKRRRSRPDHKTGTSLGTIIGATLGLLAFLLAFTFGLAAGRVQTRMQLLLDEVNAIGTTYLRAGLLREPHQSEVRKLLREYVDLRVSLMKENLSREKDKAPRSSYPFRCAAGPDVVARRRSGQSRPQLGD